MKRTSKVDFYQDAAGEWRWRVLAANGKTVADGSEGYVRLRDCEHGARLAGAVLVANFARAPSTAIN